MIINNLKSIKSSKDIETLLEAYDGFHDCCIVNVIFTSGSFVDKKGAMNFGEDILIITLNSQSKRKTLELHFKGVSRCNLKPVKDASYDCTLKHDENGVFWADSSCIDNLINVTYVNAKSLEWKIT